MRRLTRKGAVREELECERGVGELEEIERQRRVEERAIVASVPSSPFVCPSASACSMGHVGWERERKTGGLGR